MKFKIYFSLLLIFITLSSFQYFVRFSFDDILDFPASLEPDMVSINKGEFMMGCHNNKVCVDNEDPLKKVSLEAFEISRFEVTFIDWDRCIVLGGCQTFPAGHPSFEPGESRGRMPVINVSYDDVQEYIKWLNKMTGKPYRLPTSEEWEYAARAGTTTFFNFGNTINQNLASYESDGTDGFSSGPNTTSFPYPVGSFPPNPWGLYDTHGNVREWVGGNACYRYPDVKNCKTFFVRGGSFYSPSVMNLFSSTVDYEESWERNPTLGFRLARSL